MVDKIEKNKYVEQIKDVFTSNAAFVVLSFGDVTCKSTTDFRCILRGVDAKLVFVKNTLAKVALNDSSFNYLSDKFKNNVAIAYSDDIVSLSKVAFAFCKSQKSVVGLVCGASADEGLLSQDMLKHYSDLPSLPELRLQVLSCLDAFVSYDLLGTLSCLSHSLPSLLDAKSESA